MEAPQLINLPENQKRYAENLLMAGISLVLVFYGIIKLLDIIKKLSYENYMLRELDDIRMENNDGN